MSRKNRSDIDGAEVTPKTIASESPEIFYDLDSIALDDVFEATRHMEKHALKALSSGNIDIFEFCARNLYSREYEFNIDDLEKALQEGYLAIVKEYIRNGIFNLMCIEECTVDKSIEDIKSICPSCIDSVNEYYHVWINRYLQYIKDIDSNPRSMKSNILKLLEKEKVDIVIDRFNKDSEKQFDDCGYIKENLKKKIIDMILSGQPSTNEIW